VSAPHTPPHSPAAVWKALATGLSQPGRHRMKVFDPDTKEYRKTRRITDKLPRLMAAVYLYHHRRTTLLALDFDARPHGRAQVDTDVTRALGWLTSCGARVITDRSSTGGRHILVPLAIGTTASFDEIQPLLRQLAARLPSLDPTPMRNPNEGCISIPGSPCADGGHRLLDGPLNDAISTLTERSAPQLLPALYALLGALPDTRPNTRASRPETDSYERLPPHALWHKPMPDDVLTFATTGAMTRSSWPSPSEARMSVIVNAVLRGYSHADIAAQCQPGRPWSALGDSYRAKYHHRADAALARDVRKALDYTATLAAEANPPAHRNRYSQPGGPSEGPHAQWLAYALAWADREFAGSPLRWTVRDVFQALAVKAALTGHLRGGTPVVGVGGRSLSLSAGLMPPTTTFDVLRRTRDMLGAPILLNRRRIGRDADHYALVTHNPHHITPTPLDRVHITDVHPAWSILGRHHRLVYELITHTGLTTPADIYAAARISPRTGQLTINALCAAGLITRAGRTLTTGPVTLDDIAAAHRLDQTLAHRIDRYRQERAAWHAWLALQDQIKGITPDTAERVQMTPHGPQFIDHDDYLAAVLAHGPPPPGDEAHALALVTTIMGGRIRTRSGTSA